jgi:hypothetical protein
LDLALIADKVDFSDAGIVLERELDSIHDDLRTVVATHDIHSDSHFEQR